MTHLEAEFESLAGLFLDSSLVALLDGAQEAPDGEDEEKEVPQQQHRHRAKEIRPLGTVVVGHGVLGGILPKQIH